MTDLLRSTTGELRAACEELASGSIDDARGALELFGLLGALRARGQETPAIDEATAARAREHLDEALRLEALEALAVELVRAVEDRPEPDDDDRAAETVVTLLARRTEAELRRIGAEHLLGEPAVLEVEAETARLSCDMLLAGIAWRLVAYNSVRGDLARPIAPAFRSRFPWLTKGLAIPEDAVAALPAVAALAWSFPEARSAFDAETLLSATLPHLARASSATRTAEAVSVETRRHQRAAGGDPLVGRLLDDRCRIVGRLAEGGMGVVYVAQHLVLRRLVAIKLLPIERADADAVARFAREAAATARIANVHVPAVFELGQAGEGGPYYLVMELVPGTSLATEIAREGRLEPARAVHIGSQIAFALSAAHECGVLHRDVKPANVLLTQLGPDPDFVKLVDFGIARALRRDDPALPALTPADEMLGTPQYVAPEHWLGHHLDARSDVYSFGVTLFEMLTGTVPFEASSYRELAEQHLRGARPRPSQRPGRWPIPEALDAIVLRCLQAAPEARYASMTELMADLGRAGSHLEAPPGRTAELTYGATTAAPAAAGGPPSTLDLTPYLHREPDELGDAPALADELGRLVEVREARFEALLAALWPEGAGTLPAEVRQCRDETSRVLRRLSEHAGELSQTRKRLRAHEQTAREAEASQRAALVELGASRARHELRQRESELARVMARHEHERRRLETAIVERTRDVRDVASEIGPLHRRVVGLVQPAAARRPELRPLVEAHGEIDGAVARYSVVLARAQLG